ncbi:OLC1v1020135C1 [Oldenlandia corymbosa var. corymbosa]|uniref:OLC1v1020135C1 n=1 Tax=Oldenlandia corymbosa var. corymbosa TaxID=529605 RepID=A0AAV1EFR7_OLDCO|nr:OLC1v1020135C1 [Oldenlandia corymbosa var. corymbosa]
MVLCSNKKEVAYEFLPFLKVYKDGSVERFLDSPFVPPSMEHSDSTINTDDDVVSSKDIRINSDVTARIYLPTSTTTKKISSNQKLPVLAYFHGGGFLMESAFSFLCHRYMNALVSQSKVMVISVEYRLAPENPLPIAYEDSWAALQWIASHSIAPKIGEINNDDVIEEKYEEQWVLKYADFDRVFVGGDSAGANIAHNLSLRASLEGFHGGIMKIHGVLLCHPYFLGSKPIGSESGSHGMNMLNHKTWEIAYPNAPNGFDNPLINPFSNEAPSLSGLQCSRLLVCVAEKDELRERGVRYYDAVKKNDEWKGKVELFEVEGEDHCFQVFNVDGDNAKMLIKRLALFLNSYQIQGTLVP